MARYLILVVALLVSGCSITRRPPSIQPAGTLVSVSESEALIERLTKIDRELTSFKGLAKASITQDGDKGLIRYAVVFDKPDRLRLEMLPLTGFYTLSLLVVNDSKAVMLDTQEKVANTSSDSLTLLKKLLGVPLKASDMMSFFACRLPSEILDSLASSTETRVFRDPATQSYLIFSKNNQYVFRVDERTGLLREAQLHEMYSDDLSMTLGFDEPVSSGTVTICNQVRFALPQHAVEIEFNFQSLSMNQKPSPTVFTVDIPSGYEVVER